jgi:RNA recognition motif. (a.k.a. RRM, RBD, or RNP domain)
MSKAVKLFLGGLPCDLSREELIDLLGRSNKVRVNLKIRPDGRGNRGYAFIAVRGKKYAEELVAREIKVRERRVFLQYCDAKETGAQNAYYNRLYLKGIPHFMSDDDLSSFFKKLTADCKTAYAIRDLNGRHKGFGFIELKTQEACQILLNVGYFQVIGGTLQVESFKKSSPKEYPEEKYPLFDHYSRVKESTKNKYEQTTDTLYRVADHEKRSIQFAKPHALGRGEPIVGGVNFKSFDKRYSKQLSLREKKPNNFGPRRIVSYGPYSGASVIYDLNNGESIPIYLKPGIDLNTGLSIDVVSAQHNWSESAKQVSPGLQHSNFNLRFNLLTFRSPTNL